jgi:hypothetical protein
MSSFYSCARDLPGLLWKVLMTTVRDNRFQPDPMKEGTLDHEPHSRHAPPLAWLPALQLCHLPLERSPLVFHNSSHYCSPLPISTPPPRSSKLDSITFQASSDTLVVLTLALRQATFTMDEDPGGRTDDHLFEDDYEEFNPQAEAVPARIHLPDPVTGMEKFAQDPRQPTQPTNLPAMPQDVVDEIRGEAGDDHEDALTQGLDELYNTVMQVSQQQPGESQAESESDASTIKPQGPVNQRVEFDYPTSSPAEPVTFESTQNSTNHLNTHAKNLEYLRGAGPACAQRMLNEL